MSKRVLFTTISFGAVFALAAASAGGDTDWPRESLLRREVPKAHDTSDTAKLDKLHKLEDVVKDAIDDIQGGKHEDKFNSSVSRDKNDNKERQGRTSSENTTDPNKPWLGYWRQQNFGTEVSHFDSHNHIGGVIGWRGFVISYLTAANDAQFKSLLDAMDDDCGLKPADYGRQSSESTKDICLYSWIRTVYLRSNGCHTTEVMHAASCPANRVALVNYIAVFTAKVIKDKFPHSGYVAVDVPRQAWNSHTMFPLLECVSQASIPLAEHTNGEKAQKLDRMLDTVMSASPQVDFDSTYVSREGVLFKTLMGMLKQGGSSSLAANADSSSEAEEFIFQDGMQLSSHPLNSDCNSPPYACPQGVALVNYWLLNLQELIVLKLKHIQWSHPHFKLPFENCTKEFEGLNTYHFMVAACEQFEPLYWLIYTKKIPAVTGINFQYNPMFVSKVFAQTAGSNGTSYTILSGLDRENGGKLVESTEDGGVGILGEKVMDHFTKFLDKAHINGVDFASPEYNYYDLVNEATDSWTRGGDIFKQTMDIVYQKATQHNKTMFYHVHCGEGFPSWDFKGNGFGRDMWENNCSAAELSGTCPWTIAPKFDMADANFNKLCTNAGLPYSEQEPIKVNRNAAGVPIHYKNGKDNLINMLMGIARYRKELGSKLADFDSKVVIVFGHATHADAEVAKIMVDNKVWADINLSSNLATTAITELSADIFKEVGVKKTVRYFESLTTVDDNKIPDLVVRALRPHGFKAMWDKGVCMTLSTDGSGVEHSHFDQEEKLAELVIQSTSGKATDTLERNEAIIMDFLNGKRSSSWCHDGASASGSGSR